MEIKPIPLLDLHTQYPLQHQVCIGIIIVMEQMHFVGAPSTASNASLESHMTKISKTMLQLAQAHQEIANIQQQNHQTMVNVQQQQAKAFGALTAATQQQKYNVMFAAVPKYDGKSKEECAV